MTHVGIDWSKNKCFNLGDLVTNISGEIEILLVTEIKEDRTFNGVVIIDK